MSAIGTGGPNDSGDPYHPHMLASAARARGRVVSHRAQPISPAQALAVAQKIRRDVHEA